MAEHVEGQWLTMDAACDRLKVHPRKLNDYIKSGQFRSRNDPSGQTMVLIPNAGNGRAAPPASQPSNGQGEGEREAGSEDNTFVARQPIFDRKQNIFGYELLFRGAKSHDSAAAGDDSATISTINSGLNVMGLNELIGSTKAFINITEGLLLSGQCAALPPQRVVVELLENIKPTPEVIEATRAVKDLGFTVALDDVVTSDGFEPLIDLADIVKIDYMLSEPEQRRTLVKLLREKRV